MAIIGLPGLLSPHSFRIKNSELRVHHRWLEVTGTHPAAKSSSKFRIQSSEFRVGSSYVVGEHGQPNSQRSPAKNSEVGI
jgi:hypothetical protein